MIGPGPRHLVTLKRPTFVRQHSVSFHDSLVKIALMHGRSVAELKTLNNLINDTGLHCRSSVWIPASDADVQDAAVAFHWCSQTLREFCVVGGVRVAKGDCPAREGEDEAGAYAPNEDLMLRLMSKACRLDESSAKFYLLDNGFSLTDAMHQFREDESWARRREKEDRRGPLSLCC